MIEREIHALMDAQNELKPKQLIILTDDEEGVETIDGVDIRIIPLWKWLVSA